MCDIGQLLKSFIGYSIYNCIIVKLKPVNVNIAHAHLMHRTSNEPHAQCQKMAIMHPRNYGTYSHCQKNGWKPGNEEN